jgi:transcription initiation factor TFIID subunit 15
MVLVRDLHKSFLQTYNLIMNLKVMGKIPSTSNMVSSIIVSPKPAENIAANQDFTISVQTSGLSAGSFTNAAATYYAAPQDLTSGGQIIGHTHVTVEDMGSSLTPSAALDPTAFVFFKGINDAGNGKGLLSATVTGGLPAGNYRVCTMSSSSNHQPVLMPVAQRGAQDDCQKFTVGGNGATNSGAASGSGSGAASGGSAASSKAATTSTKASAKATATKRKGA